MVRLLSLLRPAAIAALAVVIAGRLPAQARSAADWSSRASQAIVADPATQPGSWNTETGLRLKALEAEWYNTAQGQYFDYARQSVDAVLANPNWYAENRSPYAANLLGEQLMLLYQVTQNPAYYQAAKQLRRRLGQECGIDSHPQRQQPPCLAQTFLAEYAAEFQQPEDFAAIARSLASWDKGSGPAPSCPTADPSDRLLEMPRMALSLTDTLASMPDSGPARNNALAALRVAATSLARHQDPKSGVLHVASTPSSAVAPPTAAWLFAYALLKGVRLGYLPSRFKTNATLAWKSALAHSVRLDSNGQLTLFGPADSMGAFLLASTEVDLAPESTAGHRAQVLLDAWFNSQQRKNAAGQAELYHYKFSDFSNSGYSLFGHMLRSAGLKTQMLPAAPTAENLRGASYYLIVSPDIPVKNPSPHYMTSDDAATIAAWVRRGGVLILMENDPPNADIDHLNLLADRFGTHFDNVLHHHILNDRVRGDHVEDGRIPVAAGGPLFHQAHTLYMKDTCAISLSGGAAALLRDRGDVVMATARYGRGVVFAAVDPWLYNEYTDGRNNPAIYSQFDNFAAGKELVQWLTSRNGGLALKGHDLTAR